MPGRASRPTAPPWSALVYLVAHGARLHRRALVRRRISSPPSIRTMCARRRASRPIRKADMIETRARATRCKRMRVDIEEWQQEGGRVFVDGHLGQADRRAQSPAISTAPTPSTTPRSRASRADGLEVTMSAAIKQHYFLFGTDNTGRDLLSRTLIAGRISLAIGLLAGVVAVVIGVLYGADRRLSRRQDRRGHDAHRRRALFAALHLLRHHAGGVLRPQFRADVPGRRRGAVARHGAHRARPGAVDPAPGICRRRPRRWASASAASCCATSFPTCSGRWSST